MSATTTSRHVSGAPDAAASFISRDEAIARIKAALKRRSCVEWVVDGGSGALWEFIRVRSPICRLHESDMTYADRSELTRLFGLSKLVSQGLHISPETRNSVVHAVETGGEGHGSKDPAAGGKDEPR